MSRSAAIRQQIETALASRIPSALTPISRTIRPVASTGIQNVDQLLEGGLPLGAITEISGSECSGRTSFALSFLAGITHAAKVCAWIDVSDAFDPESAAAAGIDLSRLLWVRCGTQHASCTQSPSQNIVPVVLEGASSPIFSLPGKYLVPPAVKKGLHGGGSGSHPRNEVKGISDAVHGFLQPEQIISQCAEPQRKARPVKLAFEPDSPQANANQDQKPASSLKPCKPWSRIEQALRVTDLLLQGGGFSAIVLDFGGIPAEHALRVPLATWFRYRAAAERTQASILLLTQHSCAKSSAELLLRLHPGHAPCDESTVFTGIEYRVEVARRRFADTFHVGPFRKPPQSVTIATWHSRTSWAGPR